MAGQPVLWGFVSYKRHDAPRFTKFIHNLRTSIQSELAPHLPYSFKVFLDTDIPKGSRWEGEIKRYLHSAHVLFPVLTPSYLTSEFCVSEYEHFQQREKSLGRSDLILPVLLTISIEELQYYAVQESETPQGRLAKDVLSRQALDLIPLWESGADRHFDAAGEPGVSFIRSAGAVLKALARNQMLLKPCRRVSNPSHPMGIRRARRRRLMRCWMRCGNYRTR